MSSEPRRLVVRHGGRGTREALLWRAPWCTTPVAADPGAVEAAPSGRPAICTIVADDFIGELGRSLGRAPLRWDAQAWDSLGPWLDWTDRPKGYPAALAREDARFEAGLGEIEGDWVRKLYLPFHRRSNMILADLRCRSTGTRQADRAITRDGAGRPLPDHVVPRREPERLPPVAPERVLAAQVVVFRVLADAAGDVEEPRIQAWIPGSDDDRGIWLEVDAEVPGTFDDAGTLHAALPSGWDTDDRVAALAAARVRLFDGADDALVLAGDAMAPVPPDAPEAAREHTRVGVMPLWSLAQEAPQLVPEDADKVRAARETAADEAVQALGAAGLDWTSGADARIRALLALVIDRAAPGSTPAVQWPSLAGATTLTALRNDLVAQATGGIGDVIDPADAESVMEEVLRRIVVHLRNRPWSASRSEAAARARASAAFVSARNGTFGVLPANITPARIRAVLDARRAGVEALTWNAWRTFFTAATGALDESAWLHAGVAGDGSDYREAIVHEAAIQGLAAAGAADWIRDGLAPGGSLVSSHPELRTELASFSAALGRPLLLLSLLQRLRVLRRRVLDSYQPPEEIDRIRRDAALDRTDPTGLGEEVEIARELARWEARPLVEGDFVHELEVHDEALLLEALAAELDQVMGQGAGSAWVEVSTPADAALPIPDPDDRPGLPRDARLVRVLLGEPGLDGTAGLSGDLHAALPDASDAAILRGARREALVPRTRFSGPYLYIARCVALVADEDPCVALRTVWSARTEPFVIAAPMDLMGQRPSHITAPDIPALVRDLPRMRRAGVLPFTAVQTPPDSGMTTPEQIQEVARKYGVAFICAFGIPVFTFIALLLFNITLNILLLIPGFGWLLLLKICIPVPTVEEA